MEKPKGLKFFVADMMEADLEEAVELEETTGLSRWGYEGYHWDLHYNPMAIMLVARGDEPGAMMRRILGFIVGRVVPSPVEDYDELHINNIATHPDFRRFGVGWALMEEAMARGRIYGAKSVRLEVRASNTAAQLLYYQLGFQAVTRRRNYYYGPTEDAVVMERWL